MLLHQPIFEWRKSANITSEKLRVILKSTEEKIKLLPFDFHSSTSEHVCE
jgi:hypothetical protein